MQLFHRRRRWRSEKPRKQDGNSANGRRILALYAAVAVVFGALTIRLLYMQVLGNSEYRLRADGNRLRVETTSPFRGLIVDRAGRHLVDNVPVWTIQIVPAELPHAREREVLESLQGLLGVPAYQMEQKLSSARSKRDPYEPVTVKTEVLPETALILKERRLSLPGVHANYESTRVYQYGDVMGHILGYTGRMSEDELAEYDAKGYARSERVGKAGVELTYESLL